MMSSIIPESAPFTEEQRAWLNGFFAGLMGLEERQSTASDSAVALMRQSRAGISPQAAVEEEDFPWHDASLPIADRMTLAEQRPLDRKLMAAMAQLDCGSCGYLCQTYAEAIASGEETNLTLCSPGGKETKQMIKKVLAEAPSSSSASTGTNGSKSEHQGHGETSRPAHSRKNPFRARLLESRTLNAEGSAKDTRHVVIDLKSSGLSYQVGDALGVFPTNCSELAGTIVRRLGADSQVKVATPSGELKPLITSLCEDCCLKDPTDELLELLIGRIDSHDRREKLARLLRDGVPDGFDVLDAIELAEGATIAATEFVETLAPLNPRLYSIASSMRCVGEEVHLTVGKVAYEREGRRRKGVASTLLAERAAPGERLRVFVQPNHGGFTVPADPAIPMIMIGPGTGIAPFRAFLQERAATRSPGDNWLFFGDQHEAYDFLYREELQHYLSSGVLSRLDTAFSRDGEKKIYVQDRMREHGAELWSWLQRGACFFVCGDASRMAADVDRALTEICQKYGEFDADGAQLYVTELAAKHRYVRDVY